MKLRYLPKQDNPYYLDDFSQAEFDAIFKQLTLNAAIGIHVDKIKQFRNDQVFRLTESEYWALMRLVHRSRKLDATLSKLDNTFDNLKIQLKKLHRIEQIKKTYHKSIFQAVLISLFVTGLVLSFTFLLRPVHYSFFTFLSLVAIMYTFISMLVLMDAMHVDFQKHLDWYFLSIFINVNYNIFALQYLFRYQKSINNFWLVMILFVLGSLGLVISEMIINQWLTRSKLPSIWLLFKSGRDGFHQWKQQHYPGPEYEFDNQNNTFKKKS